MTHEYDMSQICTNTWSAMVSKQERNEIGSIEEEEEEEDYFFPDCIVHYVNINIIVSK